jgi:sugar phosphate isomerase/epimerase
VLGLPRDLSTPPVSDVGYFFMLGTRSMSAALSRRDFIGGLATAGLAIGITSIRADERWARKFTMDLVCGNLGFRSRLPEAINLAHRFGFESVAPDVGFLRSISEDQLSELRDELKAKNLVWGAAGLPVDFRGSQASFQNGLKNLPVEATALQRAGASRIGTWITPGHNSLTYVANFKQHAARLREVSKVLGDHGVRLGLEYVGPKTSWTATRFPFIHSMTEMRELIAEMNQPAVGLVLDSWHWYTAHETETDLLALKGSEVVCCDLNDAPAGVATDEQKDSVRDLPCATGVIDLKTFLNALVRIGFDGPVRAEPFKASLRRMPPEDAVALTAKAMKQAFSLVD